MQTNLSYKRGILFDCLSFSFIEEKQILKALEKAKGNIDVFLQDKRVLKEIKYLIDEGIITTKIKHKIERQNLAYGGSINLSRECNLNCKYCFASHETKGNKRSLTELTDFYFNRYVKDGALGCWLGFNVLGEILLTPKTLKEARRIFNEIEQGKNLGVEVGIVSNGTVYNDEISEVLVNDISSLQISIDGPKEIHDKLRINKGGQETYDSIVKNLDAFRKVKEKVIAFAVLTSIAPQPVVILKHLVDELEFKEIRIRPVRGKYDQEFAFNENNLDKLKEGYSELQQFLLDTVCDGGDLRYFKAIFNEYDTFGSLIYRVLIQRPVFYACSAGKNFIEMDEFGGIYPCSSMIGIEQFKLGDIDNGIDKNKEDFWWGLHVDHKPICEDCWSRYLCGGSCYFLAWLNNGDIMKPDVVECELFQHLAELAIELVYKLEKENPEEMEEIVLMAQERG